MFQFSCRFAFFIFMFCLSHQLLLLFVVETDPYNFEAYRFKVCEFFLQHSVDKTQQLTYVTLVVSVDGRLECPSGNAVYHVPCGLICPRDAGSPY